MSAVAPSARRARSRLATRWAVLASLLALGLGLAMGAAHAAGAVGDATTTVAATHAGLHPVESATGTTCATCGDHDDGVMVACLMTLAVIALVAAVRPLPVATLITRRAPASAAVPLPRALARTPDLTALGVCRT
ncbi:hypothetical protein [Demequina sp. NBRC 110057]|uniref:hypothetical protein n=1 Tax=Demequina sp. NBRC 110057 TaxID=1570346 RepID=UPI0009FD6248|nr:hypothetical protein [Demequina sp. NBRC 110057]